MRGRIVFTVRLDFNDFADKSLAAMDAYDVFAKKVFGNLEGGTKVKTPGKLLHGEQVAEKLSVYLSTKFTKGHEEIVFFLIVFLVPFVHLVDTITSVFLGTPS